MKCDGYQLLCRWSFFYQGYQWKCTSKLSHEETVDISKYLDFGFYDKVWYIDNAGFGPQFPGRLLGVDEKQSNLICCHILNNKGQGVSRSSVQWVTQLELQTDEYK